MTGPSDTDGRWPGDEEDDRALADAFARVDDARSDLQALEAEVTNFVRQTVTKMAKGWSGERNSFVVSLPPARLSNKGKVNNRIRLLCGKVSENLRAALDYGIMRLAQESDPNLVERDVSFVIAKDNLGYERQAKRALKHVDEDVRNWLERLQPYNGNEILAFVRDTSNMAKHRSLMKVSHATKLTIVLHERRDGTNYLNEGEWWGIPAGKGHEFLVRSERSQLIVRNKHDALTVLPICIEHVHMILNALEYYLKNKHFPGEGR